MATMKFLPCVAMVAVECSNVTIKILFKAASSKGLSYHIFIAYSHVLATLVFLPVVFYRKTAFPPLKFPLFSRICLVGLTGYLGTICSYKGIELGSPTLASAVSNLSPAFTFILAVFFRILEVRESIISHHMVMREMARRYGYYEVLPSAAMVAVECSNVTIKILFKAASLKGLNYNIFIACAHVLGTLVFLPLVLYRNTALPPLKFSFISLICLLGLAGYLSVVCSYKGVELGTPTLDSAISNLTPAFTFMLAVFFRMEKVAFRSSGTQAKIIGTITSISGALVITFYKGPKIISSLPWTSSSVPFQRPLGSSQSNWIIGGLLEVVSYFLASCWYIIQTQVMKIYPEEIVVIFFYNLFVALISLPVSLIAEPNLSSWRLTHSISVAAVLYSGLFGFSFSSLVHTWGVRLKGPVFVAIFRPTSIVIAVVMGAIFLGEAVYLGSVIGAVVIAAGLYVVLWGKAKEEKMIDDDFDLSGSTIESLSNGKVPLLQSEKPEEM